MRARRPGPPVRLSRQRPQRSSQHRRIGSPGADGGRGPSTPGRARTRRRESLRGFELVGRPGLPQALNRNRVRTKDHATRPRRHSVKHHHHGASCRDRSVAAGSPPGHGRVTQPGGPVGRHPVAARCSFASIEATPRHLSMDRVGPQPRPSVTHPSPSRTPRTSLPSAPRDGCRRDARHPPGTPGRRRTPSPDRRCRPGVP